MKFFSKDRASHGKSRKKKSQIRDWSEALIVAAVLALIIRTFFVQAFKIPSSSMEDTLLIGDHLLVSKFIYGLQVPFIDEPVLSVRDPERGDVIVFEFPEDKDKSYFQRRDFIKRVIGLPGDKIEIRSKSVYVNGERYLTPEAVYKDGNLTAGPRDNMPLVTVPEHEYFVMGDNRDRSYGSRFWGFVDLVAVKGKAFIIYWSWDKEDFGVRWGRLGHLLE